MNVLQVVGWVIIIELCIAGIAWWLVRLLFSAMGAAI